MLKTWKWTKRRRRAARLLAEGTTQRDTAGVVGVSERTIKNWVATPEFDSYVIEIEGQAREQATRVLRRHGIEAAEKLVALMRTGSKDDNVQYRAVTALLARIGVAPLNKTAFTDPSGENAYEGLDDNELREALAQAAGAVAGGGEVPVDAEGETEPA